MSDTFPFHEFDIPNHLSIYVGSQPAAFAEVARQQLELLDRYLELSPDHSIFDVGCGVGKLAIPLAKRLARGGRYLGLDISKEAIEWCQRNITPNYPNVQFSHVDAQSSMYNVAGSVDPSTVRFPLEDQTVDRIFLFSVFTHMLEPEVRHYLREFRRVLRPNGKVFVTWFIVEPGVLERARKSPGPIGNFRFDHPVSDGCFVNDINAALGAVAYKMPRVQQMARDAGFEIERTIYGYWSQYWPPSDTGQDVTVLKVSG